MKHSREVYILNRLIEKAELSSLMKAPWNVTPIDYYIAGGACTSAFSGAQIRDLDIYFFSLSDYDEAVGNVKNLIGGSKTITHVFETDCAYSFKRNDVRIQYIKKVFGHPADVLKQFDFSICECAYIPATKEFIMNEETFLLDLCARRLRYNIEGKFPFASLWRSQKYIKRGFEFPAIESIKLALRIHSIQIDTYADLKEQLEGVDTLFLKDLTDILIENQNKKFEMNEALEYMDRVLSQKLCQEEDNDL